MVQEPALDRHREDTQADPGEWVTDDAAISRMQRVITLYVYGDGPFVGPLLSGVPCDLSR